MASPIPIGARAALEQAGSRLVWTDYLFLTATVAAAVTAVDPLELGLLAEPWTRHLALALTLPAVLLTAIGHGLRLPRQPPASASSPDALLWPLLLLAALVLGGSLHARLLQGIQSTFLNVGLYMLMTWCAATMVLKTGAPEALLRGYFRILLAAAAVMSVFLIANAGVRQVYHEQIFLVIPMAALLVARGGIAGWAGCAFFLGMAWPSAKYTSYIIAALSVAYLALFVTVPRLAPRPGLQRMVTVYWMLLLGMAAAAFCAWLVLHGMLELPTGNVDYRMHTYTLAWERFREAPLWGTWFAVEAVEKFTLYATGVSKNMLATHSDVLDLLANGGLVAFGLWAWGLARVARAAARNALAPRYLERPWAPQAHTLALMSLGGVVTYAFNPILLQPAMAWLLWTNIGLLAGLALRVAERDLRGVAPFAVSGAGAAAVRT
ncbi:MAG TPA: hypothetical protein VLC73_06925 [Burkholderiales bacterium]|nr:hypothetical protein [Burkholderiales bacterium]